MKKIKLYDETKKSKELENKIKQKFWLLEFLDKLYNIIMYICSFSDYVTEFEVLAERMISLDNYTWWNSWYSSLIITDKHVLSINIYIKNHFAELSDNYLTLHDWKKLYKIMIFF